MDKYKKVLAGLNAEQKKAVELLDGPLLVLAGPGTGKTQLLSARVANILQKTDTLPQNILCLTFTENAARNMRDRLTSMIGAAAYDVHISTYHSFGSDIIRQYPDYFRTVDLDTGKDNRLEKPIDDLTKTQIVEAILAKLAYDDPLKSAKYYVKSIVSTLSDLKKSAVTAHSLESLALDNLNAVKAVSASIQDAYSGIARIPKLVDAVALFERIHEVLIAQPHQLTQQAAAELELALEMASESGKTISLTAFKNAWLVKNDDDKWELAGAESSYKMQSLAHIFKAYQKELNDKSLYDFDDMILHTIEALKTHKDLLYNLQETYQYILLDEFQDTNAAQFELVSLLASNPVNEGRPNVMAVGDDDQAIYAFQGATIGNMITFLHEFVDVPVINLTQNYRSHADIIYTAHSVAVQIQSRLHHDLDGIAKALTAASKSLPINATIERHELEAEASEYDWVAHKIAELIKDGVNPEEIAILSPKHARLQRVVPFLNAVNVPVTYEKRENILDTSTLRSIELMSRCVLVIASNQTALINQYMPMVLSLDFWGVSPAKIWEINWQYSKKEEDRSWAQIALTDNELKTPVLFLLKLGLQALRVPLEHMIDALTGTVAIQIDIDTSYTSPFKEYYFSIQTRNQNSLAYYEAISHLSVIRSKLRDYQTGSQAMLLLDDFVQFIDMYRGAGEPLINSHPLAQAEHAVQAMTVYKAKGLEFEYVFLLSMHDDIWGKKARGNSNKLALPPNLTHIRYRGSGEDELRRLLFVAITRAKHGLFLTSHATTDSGKATEPVKYLLESDDGQKRTAHALPEHSWSVQKNPHSSAAQNVMVELLWQQRHTALTPDLKSLLTGRLQTFVMNPTNLSTYIDLEYGGPEQFLLRTLLKFPQAPQGDGEFGNAVHSTLDWYQKQITNNDTLPTIAVTLKEFDKQLAKRYIASDDTDQYRARGRGALAHYLESHADMFKTPAKSEVDFIREGVIVGKDLQITGKIDRLEIDNKAKTVHIVDFKTGQPASKWESSVKYLKYRQQLCFYKLLIEGSHTYKGYRVLSGRLEFIEPTKSGQVSAPLIVIYDDTEAEQLQKLIELVWQRIRSLRLDDVSKYSNDFKGTKAFIKDILESA